MLAVPACSATAVEQPAKGSDSDSDNAGERTLANCTTSMAADVPEFYQRFWRCVTASLDGDDLVIETQNLPPHRSYYYGAASSNYEAFDTSRGAQYSPNPNTIEEQDVRIKIPLTPVVLSQAITPDSVDGLVGTHDDEYPMGAAGAALDGVVIFNPLAAPGDDIEEEKYTFDSYNAHPTPNGTYHYHTVSAGPLEVLQQDGLTSTAVPGAATVELYGVMCDGTLVLGCVELDGSTSNLAMDVQGGHSHAITDGTTEYFANRYHVHMCDLGSNTVRKLTPEIMMYSTCVVE